jgi:hypothetical protein
VIFVVKSAFPAARVKVQGGWYKAGQTQINVGQHQVEDLVLHCHDLAQGLPDKAAASSLPT